MDEVERIALLLCQAKWPQWANALKAERLKLEVVVRSFITMIQRGCDQLMGYLLIDWQ